MFIEEQTVLTIIIYTLVSYVAGATNCTTAELNQTSIYKIYVNGKPVLVQQISDDVLHIEPTSSRRPDVGDALNDNLQCFSPVSAIARNPLEIIANDTNGKIDDNNAIWRRNRRHGFPPLVPPAPAPAAPQYSSYSAPQYVYVPGPPAPAPPPAIIYLPCTSPPPPPPPPPAPQLPPIIAPPPLIQPELPPTTPSPPPQYPLPECYTDDSNFMCCNHGLEKVMRETYHDVIKEGHKSCSTQMISNRIQSHAESVFNTNFEVVTGVGDFASKSHFYHNYICKVEEQGRFILAYATPKPEEDTYHPDPPQSAPISAPPEQSQAPGYNSGASGLAPPSSQGGFGNAGLQPPSQGNYGNSDLQPPPPQQGGAPNAGAPPDVGAPNHDGGYRRRRNHIYIWRK